MSLIEFFTLSVFSKISETVVVLIYFELKKSSENIFAKNCSTIEVYISPLQANVGRVQKKKKKILTVGSYDGTQVGRI